MPSTNMIEGVELPIDQEDLSLIDVFAMLGWTHDRKGCKAPHHRRVLDADGEFVISACASEVWTYLEDEGYVTEWHP